MTAYNSAISACKTLKSHREELRLSQQDVAEQLGVSQAFVAQVETGVRPFPQDRVEDLLRIFAEAQKQREEDLRLMRECMARVSEDDVMRELARIRMVK